MTALLDVPMTDIAFRSEFLGNAELPIEKSPVDLVTEFKTIRDKTMKSAAELGIGGAGMQEIREKAAHAFLKQWMMTRFACLDLSFADRKWFLKIERGEDNIPKVKEAYSGPVDVGGDPALTTLVELYRFFKIDIELEKFAFEPFEDKRAEQRRLGLLRNTRKYGGLSSVELSVSAVLPDGIGEKHVRLAQEALGHYYLARALCFTHGIDLRGDLRGDRWDRNTKIRILWGPNIEALTVTATPPRPKGDPAIVLMMFGQNYLLDFYDTPDETPITNLIREFSEGKLPKPSTVAVRKRK